MISLTSSRFLFRLKIPFAAGARGRIICSSCRQSKGCSRMWGRGEARFYFRRGSRARWRRIELPLVSSRTLFKHYRRPPRVRYSQSGWFGPSNRESLPPSSLAARICAGKGEILLRFFFYPRERKPRSRAIYKDTGGEFAAWRVYPSTLISLFHNVLLISKASG